MAEQQLVVDVVACPGCESANLPSSTVCGECGERLVPPTPFGPPPLTPLPKCSCGGRGICTVCVLALYDEGAAI